MISLALNNFFLNKIFTSQLKGVNLNIIIVKYYGNLELKIFIFQLGYVTILSRYSNYAT